MKCSRQARGECTKERVTLSKATENLKKERRFQQLCSITNAIVVYPLSSDPGRATVRASGWDGSLRGSLSFNYNTELED